MGHSMAVYQVSVKLPRGDTKSFGEALDNQSLLAALEQCFTQAIDAEPAPEQGESTMHVLDVYPEAGGRIDVLAVMCEAGHSGVSSRIADPATGDVFQRRPPHVEWQRAIAVMKLPPTRQKGLLVVHSPNNWGIRTELGKLMVFHMRDRERVLKIEHIASADAWHQLAEGGHLKALRWVRYRRTGDAADAVDEAMVAQDIGSIELVRRARRGGWMSKERIEDYLQEHISREELLTVDAVDVEFDTVKAVVVLPGGKTKTINITSERVPRMDYDVTDQLETDEHGNPTYESLLAAGLDLIDSFFADQAWGAGG